MRIYIRHAEKLYANGKSESYKHDPPLISEAISKVKEITEELIRQYGYPKVIYVSPYRRTRETVSLMTFLMPYIPKIFVDVSLSEYLGNHKYSKIDITEETSKYHPPHPECFKEFKQRVLDHNYRVKYLDYKEDVVWYITHGIFIKTLPKCNNIKHLNPLDYVVLQKEKAICRFQIE